MKIKRITSVLLLVVMLVLLIPANVVQAAQIIDSGTCGENLKWTLDSEGTLTISGTGKMESDYLERAPWRAYMQDIVTLVIENGVSTIADYAFYPCRNLTSVILPERMEDIGCYAFIGCDNLTYLTIPEGITDIIESPFNECEGLKGVCLPSTLETFGYNGAQFCAQLKTIVIPENVSVIGKYTFSYCDSLESVIFTGDAPKEIGDAAFQNTTTVCYYPVNNATWTQAIMQDYGGSVTWKPLENMGNCGERLTWYLIDGELTIAGSGAMEDYRKSGAPWYDERESITGIYIEEGVTEIGSYAFEGCDEIVEKIYLGNRITRIGDGAFSECDALPDLCFQGDAPQLGCMVFSGTSAKCYYPTRRDGWTEEKLDKFGGDISWLPYEGMGDISGDLCWVYANGKLSIFGKGELKEMYPTPWEHYVDSITSLEIEQGVTGIGDFMFAEYRSLATVILPEGLGHIGELAFFLCSSLISVNIPSGVTNIGGGAFVGCSSLTSVTFLGDSPSIADDAFGGISTTAHYPIQNDTWTADKRLQYGGTIEWKAYGTGHVHSYTDTITVPTCTEAGFTTHTCACGDSYVDAYTGALGHSYGDWLIEQEPANGIGKKYRVCAACGETEREEFEMPLTDVPNGKYYSKPVFWAYENGITKGKTATEFQRDAECTRKQIVTFLWRAAGEPEPQNMENPFVDVKADQFQKAILWAVEKGITNGTSKTEFSPEKACTRKQIVTFLYRYFGSPTLTEDQQVNPFTDVKQDQFTNAILWAYHNGITTGVTATEFQPENPCTRGQIVTFLYRAMVE